MDKQLAGLAMEFMKRVQLTGAEVPVFYAVMTELDGFASAPNSPAETDKLDDSHQGPR
jgi:hypothetical protein